MNTDDAKNISSYSSPKTSLDPSRQLTRHGIGHVRLPRKIMRRGGSAGRPPKISKPSFTPEQLEIAVQVAMYCRTINNWVISQAEFLGIDLNTPEGKKFFKENARKAAERMLR